MRRGRNRNPLAQFLFGGVVGAGLSALFDRTEAPMHE